MYALYIALKNAYDGPKYVLPMACTLLSAYDDDDDDDTYIQCPKCQLTAQNIEHVTVGYTGTG